MAISDMKSRHAVLCGKHVAASCCFMRKLWSKVEEILSHSSKFAARHTENLHEYAHCKVAGYKPGH